jgi:transposase
MESMDEDSLRLLLGQGISVEQIARRFNRDPSTVSYWMAKYELEAPNREKYAARGGIDRERLEELVVGGMTVAEIANEVGLSKSTVRHWLGKHGLHTSRRRGPRVRAAAEEARAAGLVTTPLECPNHGHGEFVIDARGCYRCRRCRSEAVSRRRRAVKVTLVAEAGGRCVICGYERCHAALAFHHLDGSDKRMTISAQGMGVAIETLRAEARKCVLLCHNCHAEVEHGAAALPIQLHRLTPEESSPG